MYQFYSMHISPNCKFFKVQFIRNGGKNNNNFVTITDETMDKLLRIHQGETFKNYFWCIIIYKDKLHQRMANSNFETRVFKFAKKINCDANFLEKASQMNKEELKALL